MKWSWRLGTFAGIGVFVHWSFLLLVAWVMGAYLAAGSSWAAAVEATSLLLAVFACVVLHEFGHALTARRYGINTKDITLLPIGGVARLERIPEKPVQELLVALAGPAVNVVIAGVLLGVIALMGQMDRVFSVILLGGQFLVELMWINLFLAAFNLLPAFPMDGGRVLRALLALRLPYVQATNLAAGTGRMMAVAFAVAGLFIDWWLLLIAAFVFLAAEGEARLVRTRAALQGVPAGDAMLSQFTCLSEDQPIHDAIVQFQASRQRDLPVVDDGRLVGLLSRPEAVHAFGAGESGAPVGRFMNRHCPTADETESVDASYWRMLSEGCQTLPVLRSGRLVGVLTFESINHWIAFHADGHNGHLDENIGSSREHNGHAYEHKGMTDQGSAADRLSPVAGNGGRIRYRGPASGHELDTEADDIPAKASPSRHWHEKCNEVNSK